MIAILGRNLRQKLVSQAAFGILQPVRVGFVAFDVIMAARDRRYISIAPISRQRLSRLFRITGKPNRGLLGAALISFCPVVLGAISVRVQVAYGACVLLDAGRH